ncbi:MAG: TIGR00282 family metallophosphoesterase [Solirubrobacteraceae bacterium]|nr:TIGR00282 family metallophosphoesterase [Solirubrobacteraceae bacterium]
MTDEAQATPAAPLTVLAIGDVVGSAGRRALTRVLPQLRADLAPDLVIVNGENASGGIGINVRAVDEITRAGADVITLGNHAYRQHDVHRLLNDRETILRPANHLASQPGHGSCVVTTAGGTRIGVVNLQGNVFMESGRHAFSEIDAVIAKLRKQADHIIVDFHAEATSEKVAMGWHLDGRVSAVVGTHTHVPTADLRVLPEGTAYITDLGMTGSRAGVIGMERDASVRRFVTHMHQRYEPAEKDPWLMGVKLTLDPEVPMRALAIEQLLIPAS